MRTIPSCSGAFVRLMCHHTQLFQEEYKRSNRNRGTKILRCFPHCCPQHVERSYCGSSLDLAVKLHAPMQTTSEIEANLFVFAHFERLERDHGRLEVGQQVSLRHLKSVSQSESNPEATWMQGVMNETQDVQDSCVFVLNGQSFSKWYYHWESGANKTQRLTKHVLKAYIFYRLPTHTTHSSSDLMQVIGIVSSSPFTVVSYRRSVVDAAPTNQDQRVEEDVPPVVVQYPPNDKSAMDPTIQRMVQHHITRAFQKFQKPATPATTSCSSSKRSSPISDISEQVAQELLPPSNEDAPDLGWNAKEQVRWIWERQHAAVLVRAKELALLHVFAENLSLGYVETIPAVQSQLLQIMEKHWQWAPSARTSVTACAPGHHQTMRQASVPLQSLLLAVYKLVVWLLSKKNITLWQHRIESYRTTLLDCSKLRDCYVDCVDTLHEQVNRFLSGDNGATNRTGSTNIRALSDAIVAVVYSNQAFTSIRTQVRTILEAQDAIGWSSFAAQVREAYICQTRLPRPMYASIHSHLNGKWQLVPESLRMIPTQSTEPSTQAAPLLWTTMQLLSQLSMVEIRLVQHSMLLIRSDASFLCDTGNNWMELVCDQKPRITRIFPNGLASFVGMATALFGGDYIAECDSPHHRIGAAFYWWPRTVTESDSCKAFRCILWLVGGAAHDTTASLHMQLSFDSGNLHCKPQSSDEMDLATWTPTQRVQLVPTWSPLWTLETLYKRIDVI